MEASPTAAVARPRGPRWGCILAAFAALAVAAAIVAVLLGLWGWRRVTRLGAASDLARIRNEVLESDLAQPEKQRLVGSIQDLRELVRTGPRTLSFLDWIDMEASIRALTRDRRLPPDEVELLERELDRLRGDLTPPAWD